MSLFAAFLLQNHTIYDEAARMSFPLNPNQQEAVLSVDGPLLILAGAGSGKTRVLTQRIIHLIEKLQVFPWQILAVTFTNKAAQEMRERIEHSLGVRGRDIWISTFHSCCLRILRKHAGVIGFEGQFAIYDDTDQKTLIKQIIAELNLNDKIFKPSSVQYHINRSKNMAITPDKFVTQGDHFLTRVQEIYQLYQNELLKNQAMDFGDLILNVLLVFQRSPDVLVKYQNQFRYIMIDEYQDTNPCQYLLIKALTQRSQNLCVVGDDDQSIYKFRGADIEIILNFQKDFPHAHAIRLEQNYRSTQNILQASNAIIAENEARLGKQLWTSNPTGDLVGLYSGNDERDEALFVAQKINELRSQFALRDIAIFYRTNAQSRSIEDALRRENIFYRIFGGMRFYDRAEIKDVMAYLKLLVNPADSLSVKRVLNVPPRGIGKTTVQTIEDYALKNEISFWQAIQDFVTRHDLTELNRKTVEKLNQFIQLFDKLKQALEDLELSEFLTFLYETTGYWQMLLEQNSVEAQGKKENLTEFVNVLSEITVASPDLRLEDFLDQISLAADVNQEAQTDQYVTLMTVHLAKGLEFPVVFLVGLEEGLFPHSRSLDSPQDIEEERRLCYVGMTRAKQKLYLSFVRERRIFGAPQFHLPSRFLSNLPEECVEKIEASPRAAMNRTWVQNSYSHHAPSKKAVPHNEIIIDPEFSQEELPFQKGSRVSHDVFGIGRVIDYEGSQDKLKVTIQFSGGLTKKLLYKHAHLTILR